MTSSLQRVEQQKALLDRQHDLLAKTTIRSPLSGIITLMNVEVGERAVPGTLNNPSATLMEIADLSVIEAEVEVDETDIVDLELNQEAEVSVDALKDEILKGGRHRDRELRYRDYNGRSQGFQGGYPVDRSSLGSTARAELYGQDKQQPYDPRRFPFLLRP